MADETPPPQHTPTPWECSDMGDAWTIFKSGTNWFLAEMSTLNPEANAAYIVKAANCHDELVLALKTARKALTTLMSCVTEHKSTTAATEDWAQRLTVNGITDIGITIDSALAKADASVEDVGER